MTIVIKIHKNKLPPTYLTKQHIPRDGEVQTVDWPIIGVTLVREKELGVT